MLKTLRGKFSLLYIALALLTALIGLVGVWNIYRLERSVDSLMTANYKSISAVSQMMEAIERQDSGALVYIGVDEDEGINLFTANGAEFQKWLDVEKGNVTEKGEHTVVDALEADYEEYSKTLYQLQRQPVDSAARRNYYLNVSKPLFEKIKSECRQLIAINEQAMFASKLNTINSAKYSMVLLFTLSVVLMAVGYAIAHYFIRRFLRPIRQLSEGIRGVREGSLYQQIAVHTGDETGSLAADFNEMTRRLKDYEQSSVGTLMTEKKRSVAIVKSISDPLIVLDASWRILLINDACADFFGLDESKVTGRHFLEAINDGALFETVETLAGAGEGHGKIVHIRKGGEYYFNLIVKRLNDSGDSNAGYIIAFQNVTGLKELEKVRTDFLATISHEFKTPLTSVMMAASMLGEGGLGAMNEGQAEAVEAIREGGDTLLGLVNELLELMRIESGKEVYRFEPCSVEKIAEASVEAFLEIAHNKGVLLASGVSGDLPQVTADFEKIRWVLNNLIGNALKSTEKGGAVSVSAECREAFVHISVQDTGEGIPPEYLDRIFDKFVQVERRDVEVRGTGLGLTVSREIVRGHGGDIRVESEPGTGSIFTFSLPVYRTEGTH